MATYLTWAGRPPTWEILGLSAVLTSAGLVATRWSLASRTGVVDWRRVGLVMIGVTVGLSTVQRVVSERSPLPDFGLTTDVDGYRIPPPVARNDVVIVGSASAHLGDPALWQETLLGNIWYASDASVQNVYTPVAFARYADVMCMNWRGETCPDLINRLFTVQPSTGLMLVDQLSIDTIMMFKDEVGDAIWRNPREGWTLAADRRYTASWVRDSAVGAAGGVAWTTAGLELTELARTETSLELRVDAVPPGGGSAAMSRLAWPGYRATAPRSPSPWTAICSRSTSPRRARGRS